MAIESSLGGISVGLIGIGAGLAIGASAIATGMVQQQAIPAALGAIAEDEKLFGKGLLFVVLPETLVIFGLVIAILLLGKM